ncbi:ABC transporter permease [Candidatus Saccharibacteria bacterium]|nr:ABC transporter permease [Candidatus Saccharibacteria bacterium]
MMEMKKATEKYRYSMILLKELVKTDFKLRYQGSVLGMVWSVLKPIMMFAIMYVVFVHFLRFGADVPHFAVALLAGNVLWAFFTEATGRGMQSVMERGDLLRKINFPKYIVVISATVSALINLTINLTVVVIFAAINGVSFGWGVLLLPVFILQLYLLALGLAFLLSALYVKFRDVQHIWDVLLQGAFFATPIIFPITMIYYMSPIGAKIMLMSPVAQVIQDVRYHLIWQGTGTVWNMIENPFIRLIPVGVSIGAFVLGMVVFRKNSKRFAEEI